MNKIIQGDCLHKLKELEDNSVDSIVTDPPYELGFMGKSWDSTGIANNVELWKECLRVLKPGGHLLAFSGTRTYHRMAGAIEDAGFEVRDMIEWVYGCLSEDSEILTKDGFKHFHKITQDDIIRVYDTQNNIYKWENPQRWSQYAVEQDTAYRIKSDYTDQIVSRNHNCLVEREGKLVFVKAEDLLQVERMPVLSGDISILQERQGELLHPELLWQGEGLAETILSERIREESSRNRIERREKPSVERGIDLQKEEGQVCLSEDKVCEMPSGVSSDGKKGRVCNGTQIESSTGDTKTANENGVCSSHQPRCNGQQNTELNVIQDERGTQEVRTQSTYNTTLATIEKIEYTGTIFCPTVSTGAFIARRNGQVFITGNSGFPKSLNIGKAVDKLQGNEREDLGQSVNARPNMDGKNTNTYATRKHSNSTKGTSEWEGWGTALKPAHEPICMARKPLAEKTVAENCLKYGTGGINIDESRVESSEKLARPFNVANNQTFGKYEKFGNPVEPQGRFPANLIHDNSEEVRECFPETKSGKAIRSNSGGKTFGGENTKPVMEDLGYEDGGGNASRFFKSIIYQAKSSKSERNKGLDSTLTVKYNGSICKNKKEENMVAVQLLQKVISEQELVSFSTEGSGENIMVQCQSDSLSTILTETKRIIELKIYSSLMLSLTNESTQVANSEMEVGGNLAESVADLKRWLLTTTKGNQELALGASRVVLETLQLISEKENWKNLGNFHSTVKPIALMDYLIKMVTPKGGIVLDPFAGSGSTLVAAKQNGFQYIGIEMTEEYIPIIEARLNSIETNLFSVDTEIK